MLKITGKEFETIVEVKIDGLSCSVEYEDGVLKRASTRGDGETGEDVTLNVKTIKSLPLKIDAPEKSYIEVRGEVYIDKKEFEKINKMEMEAGNEPFSNPRNAASGSLRQKDPSITAKRNLKFLIHSYGQIKGFDEPKTQLEYLELCERLKLPTNKIRKLCKKIDEVIDFYHKIEKKRHDLDFEIDGVVVKVNDFSLQKVLGSTAKNPRWAIAFKFKAEQAKTKLKNIIFSVGRTGIITPVAELEPVKCGGVVISNSTLHNFDEIKRLGIKIGDSVIVERAGDVIPKIVRVIKEERNGKEKEIEMPDKCPSCGEKLYKDEDGVYIRCINPNCIEQIKRNIIHFASRDAMNIEGLGESTVNELVDRGVVKSITDIYRLKKEDLIKLPLFKDKKAENLLNQIENSKTKNLDKLIYALGIRHVGEKIARILAERFKTLLKLASTNLEELSNINEVGPIIASSIVSYFSQDNVKKMIDEFRKYGLNMEYKSSVKSNKLEGLTFVFTGELESMTRDEAQRKVVELGGNISSSVSLKTSYVVCGKNPGSKLEKAKKLSVKIINEEDFLKMIK